MQKLQNVIEAAWEDLDLKRSIVATLDAAAPPEAIVATNTSALSVATIAAAASRPERVLGLKPSNLTFEPISSTSLAT